MALPITVPYTFGTATTAIPLSNLDSDYATVYQAVNGIGNGSVALANVTITGGTVSNVSGVVPTPFTANGVVYASSTSALATGSGITYNGTTFSTTNDASIHGLTVGLGAGSVATNTAVGYQAGYSNTTGATNSYGGMYAGYWINTGSNNTAFGYAALSSTGGVVVAGASNSAFGVQALQSNSSGGSNTASGYQALQANTTASNNTAVGYQAGYTNQTGAANTFLGQNAGYLTTSAQNTMLGVGSGYSTTGAGNTFVGYTAGYNVSTGAKNTIIGQYNGNQGGLDIRTSSNYIVLSDGDGNPRVSIPTGTATATIPNATGTVMVSGNMPAFSAYGSATQSIASATYTKIAFNTKLFDTNTNYDATTNYRFTPTVSGYYQVNACCLFGGGVGLSYIALYKNGSIFAQGTVQTLNASSTTNNVLSNIVYFNGSTDYIEIYCYQSTAGNLSVGSGGQNQQFSASMVRSA